MQKGKDKKDKMKNFNDQIYFNPNGCAPLALRQLCEAPDNDIMSACIHNGYDPVRGGMTPLQFRAAAQQLGISVSGYAMPRSQMSLGDIVDVSRRTGVTVIVGVGWHVLVVKAGKVLDPVNTPMSAPIDLVMIKDMPNAPFGKRHA